MVLVVAFAGACSGKDVSSEPDAGTATTGATATTARVDVQRFRTHPVDLAAASPDGDLRVEIRPTTLGHTLHAKFDLRQLGTVAVHVEVQVPDGAIWIHATNPQRLGGYAELRVLLRDRVVVRRIVDRVDVDPTILPGSIRAAQEDPLLAARRETFEKIAKDLASRLVNATASQTPRASSPGFEPGLAITLPHTDPTADGEARPGPDPRFDPALAMTPATPSQPTGNNFVSCGFCHENCGEGWRLCALAQVAIMTGCLVGCAFSGCTCCPACVANFYAQVAVCTLIEASCHESCIEGPACCPVDCEPAALFGRCCDVGMFCTSEDTCCPSGHEECANGTLCCNADNNEFCVGNKCCNIAAGEEGCGAKCCDPASSCHIGDCCPDVQWNEFQSTCCDDGEKPWGGDCCPIERVCDGNECCPENTVCYEGRCCDDSRICEQECCADEELCDPQQKTCLPQELVCPNGGVPVGAVKSNGDFYFYECCPEGTIGWCNGVCCNHFCCPHILGHGNTYYACEIDVNNCG